MKKRILAFLLAVLSVLSLISCQPNDDSETYESDDGSVKTNITPLDKADAVSVRPYVIIISENASDKLIEAKDTLYKAIKEKCGILISSSDDYLGRGEEVPSDAAEIVVGKTNRNGFSTLRYSDYTIKREGKRIFICGGSATSTNKAVEIFISKYLCENGMLVPDGGYYDVSAKYSIEKLSIEGTDISQFEIYAEDKTDAYLLQDTLGGVIGWELPVADIKSNGKHYIEMDDSFGSVYGFEIKIGEGNLTIYCDKYTAQQAIDYLKENCFTSNAGTEVKMTANDSVKVFSDQKEANKQDEGLIAQIRSEATQLKLTQEVMDNSLVSRGNRIRLAKVLRKAQKGESVTIGVIGGSITQGTGGGSEGKSYANLFKAWWEKEFPNSKLTFVNAGIGATGSMIGVNRAEEDLLKHDPDLVIIDFSVNDTGSTPYSQETYESLVRRILKQSNSPAVILLFFFNQNGGNVQGIHSEVGFNYNLPMISYKDALWPEGGNKVYQWNEISNDTIHPNVTGHAITAELIINYIQNVEKNLDMIADSDTADLSDPITEARFEGSTLYTNQTLTPTSLGSFSKNTNTELQFPNGWVTNGGANPITFNLGNVNGVYILYLRDKTGASGKADVSVNGTKVTTIDADATGDWGSYAEFAEIIPVQNEKKECTLSIKMTTGNSSKKFNILGIMVSTYTAPSAEPSESTLKRWENYVDNKLEEANLSETEKARSFIFITDTHWGINSSNNTVSTTASYVMKYASDALGGATVIHGGDLYGGYAKKAGEAYPYNNENYYKDISLELVQNYMKNELYDNFGTNFLYALGNHDTNIIGYRYVTEEGNSAYYDSSLSEAEAIERYLISDEDMYNSTVGLLGNTVVYDEEGIKEVTEIMTAKGYTQEQIREAQYMMRMHYYRDDAKSKIRYIVLDTGGCGPTQTGLLKLSYTVYMCTEYKWFANTLKSTPEGYDVVVVGHQISSQAESHKYNPNITTELAYSAYISPFYDILSAFRLGEKITVSKLQLSWAINRSELASDLINAFSLTDFDFEKKHDGKSIVMSGHNHVDLAWYVNNDSNGTDKDVMFGSDEPAGEGAVLAICTGCSNPGSTVSTDSRVDGVNMSTSGTNSLRFDIVTFRDDGSILVTRIGAGQNRSFEY